MDQILANRPKNLPPPLFMSDGSSQNSVTATPVINLDCNQHARNLFKECGKQYPKEVAIVLKLYKGIFANDRLTANITPKERLAYHQEKSGHLFDELVEHVKTWKNNKIAPDNSPFGKACDYLINRENALRGFLKYEGAPVSNNISERQMIKIALLRNARSFFLTKYEAEIAFVIFSVGLMAILAGINLFEYFVAILRHSDAIKENPESFLPWNYKKTVEQLIQSQNKDDIPPNPPIRPLPRERDPPP